MDFAALMAKEIAKAKPTADEPKKKYLKRSEIEAQRQAEYAAEQAHMEAERKGKEQQKRKREEVELEAKAEREEKRRRLAEDSRIKREMEEREAEKAKRKKLGLPELEEEKEDEEVLEDDVPDEELVEKLRVMGEPVRLFGETHKMRLKRWKKLGTVMTKGPIPTSLLPVEESEMKVDKVPPKEDKEARKWLYRQLASYFTMVLREWGNALAREEKRDTFASKAAISAMVQSKENMTPVCSSHGIP